LLVVSVDQVIVPVCQDPESVFDSAADIILDLLEKLDSVFLNAMK
jgi:hypothetical protein